MNKRILACFITIAITVLCMTACTKEEPVVQQNNSVHYEYTPSLTTAPATQADTDEENITDATETEPATEEATTVPGPSAVQGYQNEYTENGDPVLVYEVLGYGDDAVYSGNYERFVYRNGSVSTREKWTKSAGGDKLISTTDYEYDSKGTVRTVTERLPDANGELYVSCLTESVNYTDGTPATKSIIRYDTAGRIQNQTVYGYTYDDYGREILCTRTENGHLQSQTETAYIFEDNHLRQKTETTTTDPGTAAARISSLTLVYDDNGNVTERTEQDANGIYTTSCEYDSFDREINSRTASANGTVTAYTITSYEDLGGGCTRVKVMLFDENGALYDEQITCYDAQKNAFIPQDR